MTTRAELKAIMAERRAAVLIYLTERAGSLVEIATAIKAPSSTLYFLLSRLRDNDRLIHNVVVARRGGKISTWHLGPPATVQDDEADAVPIRRPVLTTWPRDFPPPDPVLAALYGRHV